MKYDYFENVKEDVKDYIKENYNNLEDIDRDSLYDDLFIEDCVTGNASGSYYCNAWKAEEAICHNMDLLKEALEMFGYFDSIDNINASIRAIREHGAEWCDVTIRCYVLGQVIDDAIEELEK